MQTTTKMQVKTIDVNCMEWFDKVNGNSYFAGTVTINYGLADEERFHLPFQYGYGSQYEQEANKELQERGYFVAPEKCWPLSRTTRELGIIYRHSLTDKCKKRDLMAINKLIETKSKK